MPETPASTLADPDRCFNRGAFKLRKATSSVVTWSCPEHLAKMVGYLMTANLAVPVVVYPAFSAARCDYRYPEGTNDDREAPDIRAS
jgi:hypothetical protein